MQPDRDLDRELRDLGSRVEYPSTPDLADSVRSRLDSEAGRPASPVRSGPSLWWLAAAAALVLLVALPVFSLAIRGTGGGMAMGGGAADSGGGGAVDESRTVPLMEEQEDGPSGGASSSAGALAGQAGTSSASSADAATGYPAEDGESEADSAGGATPGYSLGLGERITLREASARSEAPILLPRSPNPGKPDEAYDRVGAPGFILLYRAGSGLPDLRVPGVGNTGIGLVLTETSGDVGRAYLAGGTVRGAGLETADVDGGQGYWIPPGVDRLTVARSLGPSAGVLLWERDGQALRLEAGVSKKEAIRIAESVR